jgi:GNAT superfamily N-acetyltransferase
MTEVAAFKTGEMDLGLAVQLVAMSQRTWPRKEPVTPEDEALKGIADARMFDGPDEYAPMCYAVIEDEAALAVAYTFARRVGTASGELPILALAGVVVDKARRGTGLGRAVVRAAFERVDSGVFPFSLFQTDNHNRGFYTKLGAAFVDNPVVNSLSADDPTAPAFWDDLVVVYPDKPGWPQGEIDLRGPGY